ncbi:MAG: DUF1292 domain-containing protein [Bacilli bacterium]|nr:DUF1292 domain-containing protein [Bacilli bacterium]
MNEENNNLIIEMTDDKGEKVKVEIVNHFEDNGKVYVIANDLSNDTDSYLLEYKVSENGEELVSIDDEEEFERLCKLVEEMEE